MQLLILDFFKAKYLSSLLLLTLLVSCSPAKRTLYDEPLVSYSWDLKSTVKPLVVVDPGHGGKDPGARMRFPPYTAEKVLALKTALLVEKTLKRMGYNVLLTRTKDVFIELPARPQIAARRKGNLFVSIHYNSCPKASVSGIEVYYYQPKKNTPRTDISKRLATAVLQAMCAETKALSRGVRPGDFCVIRETKMPAILVEGGFLTSPQEVILLRQPKYLEKIARGIAIGVDTFWKARSSASNK